MFKNFESERLHNDWKHGMYGSSEVSTGVEFDHSSHAVRPSRSTSDLRNADA